MSARPSLLFVNQHYWPDVAATAQMLTDLAEYLVVRGYDVTVLCSKGKYAGGGRVEARDEEKRNGVRIVRLSGTGFGRRKHLGRLADYATFLARVTARLLRGRKYDLVILLTTPSLLDSVGWVMKRLRGQRFVIWSMDVHPEIEERLGILPGGWRSRIFHRVSESSHQAAERVVALGECMKEVLARKGVPEERIHVIPVWGRGDQIVPVHKAANPLVSDLGLDGRFVVMYSGNAGLAHRFEEVLGASERTRDDADIEWVFAGEGPRKREIIDRVGNQGNFRYLDYWPREMLKYSLSIGDVHLVTMRNDMAGLVVPAKVYGIMAAGRPMVFVGPTRSDTARMIDDEEIGYVIDEPEEEAGINRLVGILRELRTDREKRKSMGRRAREAFVRTYERNVACATWEETIREMVGATGNHEPETARGEVGGVGIDE